MPTKTVISRFGSAELRSLDAAIGSFQFWTLWPSPIEVEPGEPEELAEIRGEVRTAKPEMYRWLDAALTEALRGYGSLTRQHGTVRIRRAAAEEFKTGFKKDCRSALDRLLFKVSIQEFGKREAVELLLPVLVDAPSRSLNAVFEALLTLKDPCSILQAAFSEYDRTGRQRFLSLAVSLLEQLGQVAWPVLQKLARSPRPECELFVDAIANCEGVALEDRVKALQDLFRRSDPDVQSRVSEALTELGSTLNPHVLQVNRPDEREGQQARVPAGSRLND